MRFTWLLPCLLCLAGCFEISRNSESNLKGKGTPTATPTATTSGTRDAEACQINQTPIDESYRTMIGRNATPTEACHYAALIQSGAQFAYYEPYPPDQGGSTACGWVGLSATADPNQEGIDRYNATEWSGRGADNGMYVSTLFVTLFGTEPAWSLGNAGNSQDPTTLFHWVDIYLALPGRGGAGDPSNTLATDMQGSSGALADPGAAFVTDVLRRELGREPNFGTCTFSMSPAPAAGTDCYWLYSFANGTISTLDVIHQIRSTPEYIEKNIVSSCSAQYYPSPSQIPAIVPKGSSLYDQHAIGEYITQLYRLFLGRYPTASELSGGVSQYPATGGDTTSLLAQVAQQVTSSVEYLQRSGSTSLPENPPSGVDLVVNSVLVSTGGITVVVGNLGAGVSAQAFSVEVISPSGLPVTANGSLTVPASGQTVSAAAVPWASIGLSAGQKAAIEVIVDPQNNVLESNKLNNVFTETVSVPFQ